MDEWLKADKLHHASVQKPTADKAAFATIHISGGRKDKISPGDIVGALLVETGLKAADVGKIEVQDRQSYVAVPATATQAVIERLSNSKIKGRKFKVSLVK